MTDLPPEDTLEGTLARMRARLSRVLPDFEIQAKAEIAHKINPAEAGEERGHSRAQLHGAGALPLRSRPHRRLPPTLRGCLENPADIIVFCGVWFMGETAKILNPGKTVIVPSDKAGCSLAEGITAEDVRALKERFPGAPVVTYVNTYADVKAESDTAALGQRRQGRRAPARPGAQADPFCPTGISPRIRRRRWVLSLPARTRTPPFSTRFRRTSPR
jgi:quinolinate synthase